MHVNAHPIVPNMKNGVGLGDWLFSFCGGGALSVHFSEVSMEEETKKALRETLGMLLGLVQCIQDAEKLQQAVCAHPALK